MSVHELFSTFRLWEEITREEVAPLLEGSPFRKKIDHLLDNQSLGSNTIGYSFGHEIYPSCRGTALHVLGAERVFLDGLEFREKDSVIVSTSSNKDDFFMFPKDFDSPSTIKSRPARKFLSKKCRKVDRPIPGCLVATSGVDSNRIYRNPAHMAVYLGSMDDDDYVFDQRGVGDIFKFSTIRNLRRMSVTQEVEFYVLNGSKLG